MKRILIIALALVTMQLNAQDLAHYKRVVKELSSAKYQGRGYAKGGANKDSYEPVFRMVTDFIGRY